MKKLVLLLSLLVIPAVASASVTDKSIQYFHDYFTFGVGVKWEHPGNADKLKMDQNMWVGGAIKIPVNTKVGFLGTFERSTTALPDYEIKAGVWFKP